MSREPGMGMFTTELLNEERGREGRKKERTGWADERKLTLWQPDSAR